MAFHTAVIYGNGRQDIKAARFVVRQLEARGHDVDLVDSGTVELPMPDLMYGEYEWYANALKATKMKDTCSTTNPVQQGLCGGNQ